jgi:hypothetical protein
MSLPFHETFQSPLVETGWRVGASPGNTVCIVDGGLKINAAQNTYAHIERPLRVVAFRLEAALTAGDGESWATSLVIYWDKRNWLRIVTPNYENSPVGGWWGAKGGGKYSLEEMVNGTLNAVFLAGCYYRQAHRLAIELAKDGIRCQCSADGELWAPLALRRRPASMKTPPKLLIVGKGYGDGAVYPAENLNNNYSDPGPRTETRVHSVAVTGLPKEREQLTETEKRQMAEWGRDWLGEKELTRRGGPTFESVSRHFPAMKWPREVIGLKDHAQDVGVAYDGLLQLANQNTGDYYNDDNLLAAAWEVGEPPQRLGRKVGSCKKSLHKGYLPIVVCRYSQDGLNLEQTAFGYADDFRLDRPIFAYSRLKVTNPSSAERTVRLAFRIRPTNKRLSWTLSLPGNGEQIVCARVPFSGAASVMGKVETGEFTRLLAGVEAYWEELLNRCMKIRLPEHRVQNAYRAWLAYQFLNIDQVPGGEYGFFDGSGFYEELYGYSACQSMQAFDEYGYHDADRKYIESNLKGVNPQGVWVTNFGLPDNAAIIETVVRHYRLTGDAKWFKAQAPTVVRICDWIIRARRNSVPHATGIAKGLVYYRPYADYPEPTFCYLSDACLCRGLEAAAQSLAEIGMTDDAKRIGDEAAAYRADILRSMDAAAFTHDGVSWLPMMPTTRALLLQGNYRADDYWGLVASMLLETGFLSPDDSRARLVASRLEDRGGLCLGCQAWRGGINHAYTYGYLSNALRSGQAEKAVLGLYGGMAYGMTRETYAGAEVSYHRTGDTGASLPHSYSAAEQLLLLRNMLVREEGRNLILAQATPRHWLAAGKKLEVLDAPTFFGKLSYSIHSEEGDGKMTVTLVPPTRRPPRTIVLHLRHPDEGRTIQSVTVNGVPSNAFQKDTVTLTNLDAPSTIEARY